MSSWLFQLHTHTRTHRVQLGGQKQINWSWWAKKCQARTAQRWVEALSELKFEFWVGFMVDCLAFLVCVCVCVLCVIVVSWFMAKNTLSEPHKNILATIHTSTTNSLPPQRTEAFQNTWEGIRWGGRDTRYIWDTVRADDDTYLPSTFAHILHNIFREEARFWCDFCSQVQSAPLDQWVCEEGVERGVGGGTAWSHLCDYSSRVGLIGSAASGSRWQNISRFFDISGA